MSEERAYIVQIFLCHSNQSFKQLVFVLTIRVGMGKLHEKVLFLFTVWSSEGLAEDFFAGVKHNDLLL